MEATCTFYRGYTEAIRTESVRMFAEASRGLRAEGYMEAMYGSYEPSSVNRVHTNGHGEPSGNLHS